MALKAIDNLIGFLNNSNFAATDDWETIIGNRTAEMMKTETAMAFDLEKKNSNANKRLKYINKLFKSITNSSDDTKSDEKSDDSHSFYKPVEDILDLSNGDSKPVGDIEGIYSISSQAGLAVGCNFGVKGRYYYEVELIEDPSTYKTINIGFANDSHSARQEVGLDGDSYGYNGVKNKLYHMDTNYGNTKWKVGDIIGFALNGTTIEFYLNGISQGIAFNNVDCTGNLFAGLTLQKGQFGTFIYAEDKLKQSKPNGYDCIPIENDAEIDNIFSFEGDIVGENVDCGIKITANQGFPTALCEIPLTKDNKYYFEFELGTAGCMQVGFADEKFEADDVRGQGIGDDEHSWGCDFLRMRKWGIFANNYCNANWTKGDIIGCILDYNNKCISYSLNGKDLGIAFENINCDNEMFPCISIRNLEARKKLIAAYQKQRAAGNDANKDDIKLPEAIIYFNLIFCDKGYKYKPNGFSAMTECVPFKAMDICNGLKNYSYQQYKLDYSFMDSVIMLKTDEEFHNISKAVGNDTLIVCDFWATWCGPCIYIAPHYHKISEQFPDVVFLKADVDKLKKLSKDMEISCMPTFKFFKDGKEVHKIEGADKDSIVTAVEKYSK